VNDWRSYDDTAGDYERLHAPVTSLQAGDLTKLAGIAPGQRVLDVGTGTGVTAEAAARAAGPSGLVVGVDVSVEMLTAGRHPGRGYKVAARAFDLPFPGSVFDAVTGSFVLSHFKDYKTAMFDMLRVLKSGGALALASWGLRMDEFRAAWQQLVEGAVGHDLLADAYRRAVPWEDLMSDEPSAKETLAAAGLRRIEVRRAEYSYRTSLEDYISARETGTSGRFVRSMLADGSWEAFRTKAREAFAERFPDPITDFVDVILAVGRKE
jgi:ubiquinone/menaquinone biosynthesis C-methylase UbiE